ncbi:MAG: hypothetical protein ISS36_03205 [Candidatus Aenigmarchaeota archaeon]|nr:hypothetical protein [Candidatus Aenigmarchaeota archaeon]
MNRLLTDEQAGEYVNLVDTLAEGRRVVLITVKSRGELYSKELKELMEASGINTVLFAAEKAQRYPLGNNDYREIKLPWRCKIKDDDFVITLDDSSTKGQTQIGLFIAALEAGADNVLVTLYKDCCGVSDYCCVEECNGLPLGPEMFMSSRAHIGEFVETLKYIEDNGLQRITHYSEHPFVRNLYNTRYEIGSDTHEVELSEQCIRE